MNQGLLLETATRNTTKGTSQIERRTLLRDLIHAVAVACTCRIKRLALQKAGKSNV